MIEYLFARINGESSSGRLSNTGSAAKTQIIKLPSGRDLCMARNKAKGCEGEKEGERERKREKRSGS